MKYKIISETLCVEVTTLGAELISIRYKGKEKLWQNQTGTWDKHSPLLFPVCGHFGCIVNGTEYPMPAHGVVQNVEFSLKEKGEDFMTFTYSSNEETKKRYPFDFVFSVTYRVEGSKLSVSYEVENPQNAPLYFSCGGHESFMLDSDVDGYKLLFDEVEEIVHFPHDADGFLLGEKVPFATGKEFPIPKEYLLDGNTIILGGIRSGGLTLCKTDGTQEAKIKFDGFNNLLLWRPDDNAHMVCIEPWTNLPDMVGNKQEFSQKDGVIEVEGKSKKTMLRSIEYLG